MIKKYNWLISNFSILILKRSKPTLDYAHGGRNLQSKMTDIENVNFSF